MIFENISDPGAAEWVGRLNRYDLRTGCYGGGCDVMTGSPEVERDAFRVTPSVRGYILLY